MSERTVGVLQLVDLLKALRTLGADPEQLCRAVGLAPVALRDLSGRVSGSLPDALLDEARRRLRDPFIGLHAGAKTQPRGPLAYLLLSCPRLEWALRRCGRFSHLADAALRLGLHRRGNVAHFVVSREGQRCGRYPHIIDYVLVTMVNALRAAITLPEDLVVHLRQDDRDDPAEFARAFGCPVRFGRGADALVLPLRALAMPSRFANPMVAERIEDLAKVLEQRAMRDTVRARVADAVREMVIAGVPPDRMRVSRRLGMSGRTLQRALAREGLTFKEVRDDVRWDGVAALLTNPSSSVKAAATSAGFADTPGFSRAFRRRMGCSPSGYRARAVG